MYKIILECPKNEHFHRKMQFQNDQKKPIFTIYFFYFQTASAPLRNVRSKHVLVLRCREFYSESFKKIKKGGTRFTFLAIFEKLKQNRNFHTFFSL